MTEIHTPDFSHFSASNSDTLLTAFFVAAVLHVIILLGINFRTPQLPKVSKSIEVTISHTPLKKAPKLAKHLAPDHQIGIGDYISKPEQAASMASLGREQVNRTQKIVPETVPEPKKPVVQKIVIQPQAPVKALAQVEQTEQAIEVIEEKPKLSAEQLQQQIAQLGERIRSSQQSSQDAKIKFVNSIATHKFLAAQYVKDWEDKVERTGNLNYPEAARNKSESQVLTMDVGINADGSIYSLRIVNSSGNPALDEAAKRIVKMSAPFAELPIDLLHEVNVLVITRVWKFSDETGMTAR